MAIRKRLTDYLKVADDITQPPLEYTEELKTELDKRYTTFKKGGKMVSGREVKKQISKILAA